MYYAILFPNTLNITKNYIPAEKISRAQNALALG